ELKEKQKHMEGHSFVNRRDFLAHGLMAGFGTVMLPSLLSALRIDSANALDCGAGMAAAQARGIPILIFDLAGGSNVAGSNVMVGKTGGQMDYLTSYKTLGLPDSMHPKNSGQTSNELGLQFHADSAILRGIQSTTAASTRAKVDGAVFCASSNDDTANNPHNPIYWLTRAGAIGDLSPMAGTQGTTSGGNSTIPQASIIPTMKPVTINTPKDALNLVTIGKLGTIFGNDKTTKILKAAENMSATKVAQFSRRSLPDQLKDLINCGYLQSQDAINKFLPSAVDPTLDATVTSVFTNMNDADQRKTATIAKLIFDGHVGVGTITLGGFDYHTDNRSSGEDKDFKVGDLIGRVMELAAKKQKDVFIYVITDGGVSSNGKLDATTAGRGKLGWGGDSSQRASTYFLYYRQAGKATLRTAGKRQIGAFKDNENVDLTASLISNNVTNLAKVVVANYLALSGKESTLETIVGDNPFGLNLKDYLIFNKSV
ncbi:MAG: hypothetical protein Q7U04_13545, partial [Bacteriovorax sp.]|nr:hypothetical protein [Bacteriovorax sp.]